MTRPPLYTRRPFLAGLLRQLPLLVVLLTVGTGLLMVTFEHWRRGLVVVGLALVGGDCCGCCSRCAGSVSSPSAAGRWTWSCWSASASC